MTTHRRNSSIASIASSSSSSSIDMSTPTQAPPSAGEASPSTSRRQPAERKTEQMHKMATQTASRGSISFSRFLGQVGSGYHSDSDESVGRHSPAGGARKTVQLAAGAPTDDPEKEAGEDEGLMERGSRRRKTREWSIRSLLLGTILSVSLLINVAYWLRHLSDRAAGLKCYPTHASQFVANDTYANVYTWANPYWEALGGKSAGVIYTSQGQADGKVRPGGMSMFHQLHCLDSFRHAIQQLQHGDKIGYDEKTDVSMHQGHWPHCFDYLRQTLLCYADDTVEPSWLDDGYKWTIDGYHNTKRTCRDSARMYRMTDCGEKGCPGTEHYVTDAEFERIQKENEKDAAAQRVKDLDNGITREWALPGAKTKLAERGVESDSAKP
ncbi:hypothetical protein K490DRAFT_61024 [Saccharata proteae CBS 121410]|uniref:Uncharacterized protein n=1 Tax=Saccharata proteae CBS 121410 TaxID=1314787 RepID=A0A9P4I4D4_9PEZI|nr:hypothetical protein K490DRAFT_61024 [Saccharata proteae CBS 121410]